MTEISRFFGIVIRLYYNDHGVPHFHARYGSQEAVLSISTIRELEGRLSRRILGLVIEWALLHQDELMDNWRLARQGEPLRRIAPLE